MGGVRGGVGLFFPSVVFWGCACFSENGLFSVEKEMRFMSTLEYIGYTFPTGNERSQRQLVLETKALTAGKVAR